MKRLTTSFAVNGERVSDPFVLRWGETVDPLYEWLGLESVAKGGRILRYELT